MNYRLILAVAALLSLTASAAEKSDSVNLMPAIHGTLKTNWEWDTDLDEMRFLVRNARLGVTGYVTREVDYKVEIDFCDRGELKVLDAWAALTPARGVKVQLGQVVLPFGIAAPRPIFYYPFADISFLSTLNGPIRNVGAKVTWQAIPALKLEGCTYNTYTFAKQAQWQPSMSYAAQAYYKLFGCLTASVGFESNVPDHIRINNWDAALQFAMGRVWVDAEWLHKHYTHRAHASAQGWDLTAGYRWPVKVGSFNFMSVEGRWDGMTAYSNGTRDDNGLLTTTLGRRQRASAGITLSCIKASVKVDFHLDYYHTFLPHDAVATPGDGNKIAAQAVLRF